MVIGHSGEGGKVSEMIRGWGRGVRLALASAGLVLVWAFPCRAGWIFDGRPSTWEGTPEELKADEETFPVLRLELGGQWTDFELKASTNNFADLVFYIKSSGPTVVADDPSVWVYFTDDYSTDVRQWLKSAPATAIGSQLADPVNSEVEFAIVCPSHECAVDWRTWMSRTNTSLAWSFVRYDGSDLEMNATGTMTHWSAVVPVEWRRARVAP